MNLLFLHGYAQSGTLFNAKTKALQKSILKALPHAKFHFPTAPHALTPADLPGEPTPSDGPLRDCYGWWSRTPAATDATPGVDATLEQLKSYIASLEGGVDGIVGFSQGAALAVVVAGVMERGEWEGVRPVKWVVEVAGFRAEGGWWGGEKVRTPVLHVMGTLDTVVGEEKGMAMVRECEGGEERVLRHPGGHYVPGGKMVVGAMVGWMVKWGKEEVAGNGGEREAEEDEEDDFPF